MRPGAPVLHAQGAGSPHRAMPSATSSPRCTATSATSTAGFAEADVVHEGTYVTQRVQHARLETHAAIGWLDEDGRLNVRVQHAGAVPDPPGAVRACSTSLPDKVRVFCGRVGGGFGGKQEMLVEDIVALAALRTGRPVQLEFTREEQFTAATTRHPMRGDDQGRRAARRHADRAADARRLQHRRLRQPRPRGAVPRAAASRSASTAAPNKKVDGYAVYTNTVPAGAFRGYGLGQSDLRRRVGDGRAGARARHGPDRIPRGATSSGPATRWSRTGTEPSDVEFGSYGLDQCLDLVRGGDAAAADARRAAPDGWLVGEGMALAMIAHGPARRALRRRADRALRATARYELAVGTAEFGNGTTPCTARSPRRCSAPPSTAIRVRQSDTDARRPRHRRLRLHRHRGRRAGRPSSPRRRCASASCGSPPAQGGAGAWRLDADAVTRGARRMTLASWRRGAQPGGELVGHGRLRPARRARWRSTCRAFRVAVQPRHRRDPDPAEACRPPTRAG